MNNFYGKLAAITAAIVIILFLANRLIIKELKNINLSQSSATQSFQYKQDSNFKDKQKKKINWKDAKNYIGEYVEVEGEIVSSYNSGKVCFLNFHKDYKNYLTLVIFASDFKKFPDKPEKYYLGKKINVEGRLIEYKGKPEIKIKTPDQINIIE